MRSHRERMELLASVGQLLKGVAQVGIPEQTGSLSNRFAGERALASLHSPAGDVRHAA